MGHCVLQWLPWKLSHPGQRQESLDKTHLVPKVEWPPLGEVQVTLEAFFS